MNIEFRENLVGANPAELKRTTRLPSQCPGWSVFKLAETKAKGPEERYLMVASSTLRKFGC
jgi:hypothetical protein